MIVILKGGHYGKSYCGGDPGIIGETTCPK